MPPGGRPSLQLNESDRRARATQLKRQARERKRRGEQGRISKAAEFETIIDFTVDDEVPNNRTAILHYVLPHSQDDLPFPEERGGDPTAFPSPDQYHPPTRPPAEPVDVRTPPLQPEDMMMSGGVALNDIPATASQYQDFCVYSREHSPVRRSPRLDLDGDINLQFQNQDLPAELHTPPANRNKEWNTVMAERPSPIARQTSRRSQPPEAERPPIRRHHTLSTEEDDIRHNPPATIRNHSSPEQRRLAKLISQLLTQPTSVLPPVHRSDNHGSPPSGHSHGLPDSDHIGRILRNDLPRAAAPRDGLSIPEWLAKVQDEDIPYVLDSTSLKRGHNLAPTTANQRRQLFCGYGSGQSPYDCPILSISKDAPVNSEPFRVFFDVDSYLAFASSLAVAKNGLKVLTIQRPTPLITASLHLGRFKVWWHDDPCGDIIEGSAFLHEIPHVTIGRFVGNDDLELCLFFPHAVRTDQMIAKLPDEIFERWMDELFLPILHEVLPASQSRTFPINHADAVSKSQIRMRNLVTEGRGRRQLLAYHIQPQYLHRVWGGILRRLRQGGFPLFEDGILLVTAKGIKLSTSSASWSELSGKVRRLLTRQLDSRFIQTAYYDIGKEWGYPWSRVGRDIAPSGEVVAWNLRYLHQVVQKLRELFPRAPPSALRQQEYPQYFLHGVGSTTVEASHNSPFRVQGLLFTQWYNPVKDLFAAGDQYLGENPALADLGLDPIKLAVIQHAAQAVTGPSPDALVQSYLHLKHHIHNLHQNVRAKSYGLREEYRVRQDLFELITEQMRTLEAPGVASGLETTVSGPRLTPDGRPHTPTGDQPRSVHSPIPIVDPAPAPDAYVRLATTTFMDWTAWNINRFCFGLEFIFADVPPQTMISWEQTRAISMFFLAIPCFLGQLTAGRGVRFWHDELPRRADDEPFDGEPRQGMGMLQMLARTGFPWFMNKLNWASLTFKSQISAYLGFQRLEVERRLRRHAHEVLAVRDFSQRIENSYPWLIRFGQIDACRQLLFHMYFQICSHQFRRDTLQAISTSLKDGLSGDIRAGNIPLCYDALADAMVRGARGLKIKGNAKDKLKSWTQLSRALFLDQVPRHAQNVTYHLVYRSAIDTIANALGTHEAQRWSKSFLEYVRATNWLLPYSQNNRFMNRDPQSPIHPQGKPFLFWSSWNHEIDRDLRRRDNDILLPLPLDWEQRYRGRWVDHCKGMPYVALSPRRPIDSIFFLVWLKGRPELDIALITTPSTALYEQLVGLAGTEVDLDDLDDEEYLPDPNQRVILRPIDLLTGDDRVEEGRHRTIQTRAALRDREAAESQADEDLEMTEEAFEQEGAIDIDDLSNSASDSEE